MATLARRWLDEHVALRCKPKTESMYRLIVDKHVVPALGRMPALAVEHARVTELHHRLCATPVMANQVVDTLSRIYNAAGDPGDIPEACNPCRLVAKNRERKRERFLTDAELRRLGQVLDEAGRRKGVSVHAAAASQRCPFGLRPPSVTMQWTWMCCPRFCPQVCSTMVMPSSPPSQRGLRPNSSRVREAALKSSP